MKIVYVAVAGIVLGVGGGTMMSAMKVKGEILEARALAAADSATATTHGAAAVDHGDDGAVAVVLSPEAEGATEGHGPAEGPSEEGLASEPDVPTADHAVEDPQVAEGAEDQPAEDASQDSVAARDRSTPAPATAASSDPVASDAVADGTANGALAETEEAVALNPEGARKLAKIFGAMKPADAAAVLAEMTDAEVKAVLLQMNDRKAAPILGNFPAERAATLSSVVLRDRGGV